MNKKKRRIIAIIAAAIAVFAVYYLLFVCDSSLNLYKKARIKSYAESYVSKNYPLFKLEKAEVSYDRALGCYVADCRTSNGDIVLNYNSELFMEFDCYYNEKYTSAAVKYQSEAENRLGKALKNAGLKFDSVTVYIDLDAADKENIVYRNAEIKNERLSCTVTYVRAEGDAVWDKNEFAKVARDTAKSIYNEIGDDAQIASLKIKYDYDDTKLASISWSKLMNDMTLDEIAAEIKY